ncbi:MAG TPA: thiamine phosphate synthase [Thermoplasmata archaeon]|nr:thiamine phosphate synthase [Thermoplasmata archaeon]
MGGVYLVTAPKRPVSSLVAIVAGALEGGASLVQLRDKGAYAAEERAEAATGIRERCARRNVPFLVNDDPRLALLLRADGVHVGQDDPSPRIARALLGPKAIVGVTVYGKSGEEGAAAAAGADYIAVGPFFPSPTKPEEPVLPLHVLDGVVHRARIPVFAIGGVTAENAGLLARHGVAGVAVASAIMNAPDPRAATEAIRCAFEDAKSDLKGTRTPAR